MAGLNVALPVAASIFAGMAGNDAAQAQATQMDYQAGQQRAAAQRTAQDQRRQAALVNSRVQAVAGGGGLDPTVVGIEANNAGEGELRALTALYEGDSKASTLEAAASAKRSEGRAKMIGGAIGAASSVFAKPAMFEKYGNGGFSGVGAQPY